jgi:glycosyltransferase involved in cell wall biosynthesis
VAPHAGILAGAEASVLFAVMTAMPLVDVGIPTYGRPRFLSEAIECVLAQTYTSWELAISENSAEGAVAEIVKPYLEHPKIHYVSTTERFSGPAQAKNVLFGLGEAPYVALLHDDDLWDPEFLERRVDVFQRHSDCGYVFGGNLNVDEEGRELSRSVPALAEGEHQPEAVVPLLLRNESIPMPPTAMIRRGAYESVGGSFEERFMNNDYEMFLRLALRYPVYYVDVWDSAYRIHPQQVTYRTRVGEQLLAFHDHVDELVRRELPEAQLPETERRRRRAAALVSAAIDALLEADRSRALARLKEAARIRPAVLLHPRVALALPAFVFGQFWRRLLGRARVVSRRRDYLRGAKRSRWERR